jgi:DNA-binding response OmpR family regulator
MTAHILLVEDDARLAQLVETELSLEGYRVTVA